MNSMKTNELCLWCSILILLLTGLIGDYIALIKLVVFWIIIIICFNNVKRLNKYKSKTIIFFRRNIYIIPLLLPLTTINLNNIVKYSRGFILIGIVVGIVFLLINFNTWRIILNKFFILSNSMNNLYYRYMDIYTLIMAAVSEELFFRAYILSLPNIPIILSVCISIFLFVLFHYGIKHNNQFSMNDYIIQLIFSIISCMLFIFFDSIIPSVGAHLTYNSVYIVKNIKSIYYITKEISIKDE